MIPDIEVQLQVIIKSLKDNVVPAIDVENELAQQQIQLSLAALEITLGHLPLVHGTLRKDIAEHLSLARKLFNVCNEASYKNTLDIAMKQAVEALNDPVNGFTQLQQSTRLLRDAIGVVIAKSAESEEAKIIEKIVLEASGATLSLGRAWNKPMGFEPDPKAVEELVSQLGLEK